LRWFWRDAGAAEAPQAARPQATRPALVQDAHLPIWMEDAAGELPADALVLVIVSQFKVVDAQVTGTEMAQGDRNRIRLGWGKPPTLYVV